MRRVLHLVGSPTDEAMAELSRLYARDCLAATAGCADHVIVHVDPDRRWRFPATLGDADLARAPALGLVDALARIGALAPDAVLPQMFCRAGMVEYRALFDVLGIPLIGNRAETMALTAEKSRAKAVVAAAGVAVPAGEVVRDAATVTGEVPLVVKPADGDNSAGLTLVRDRAELARAIRAACAAAPSGSALVEDYVELGREVRCGILDLDGSLRVLPLEEYAVGPGRPIRDAADKLGRDATGALALMAKDASHAWILDAGDPAWDAVADAAVRAHRALGARHYSLCDFRLDPSGRPWFLEAGLYCSFARQSVIATMARADGIEVDALFRSVLRAALAEPSHERRPHAMHHP